MSETNKTQLYTDRADALLALVTETLRTEKYNANDLFSGMAMYLEGCAHESGLNVEEPPFVYLTGMLTTMYARNLRDLYPELTFSAFAGAVVETAVYDRPTVIDMPHGCHFQVSVERTGKLRLFKLTDAHNNTFNLLDCVTTPDLKVLRLVYEGTPDMQFRKM